MDEDIKEIKALAKQALALAEDTNHIVRGMRSAQRWGRFFQFVWWMVIIGVSSATYYYYLQPYVGKLEDLYMQVQSTGQQSQNIGTQLQDLFKSYTTSSTSTTH